MADVRARRTERRLAAIAALLSCYAAASGCDDTEPGKPQAEAGPDGAGFGEPRDAALLDVPLLACSDGPCREPEGSPVGTHACCLPDGLCGLAAWIGDQACHDAPGPGSLDLSCPERRFAGGAFAPGCCTPSGVCSVQDDLGGLGCVPPETTGGEPECEHDPDANCLTLAELPCDGPEDCEAGNECCGRVHDGRFDRFGCFPSCAERGTGRDGVWLPLCGAGASCAEGLLCRADAALPDFLGVCRKPYPRGTACHPGPSDGGDAATSLDAAGPSDASDADGAPSCLDVGPDAEAGSEAHTDGDGRAVDTSGVRCGEATCGDGEKCCLRAPRAPYCSRASVACTCSGTAPGKGDGGDGGDGGDAGSSDETNAN